MTRALRIVAAVAAMTAFSVPAVAQKSGGILKIHLIDSPASMSIHEEATVVAERPVMGVFNNLVIFDQHIAQNSLDTIRPELATKWSWNEEGTELTFDCTRTSNGRRQAVHRRRRQMHPDLLAGRATKQAARQPERLAPTRRGQDRRRHKVTFVMTRPQPPLSRCSAACRRSIPATSRRRSAPASDWHRRSNSSSSPNEAIRLVKNPDYWKPGLPYLDGIRYTVSRNRSTVIPPLSPANTI